MIWIGQKLHPDVPLYNQARLFTIRQALRPECFRSAFQTLISSSDALRMFITEVDGVPRYRVKPVGPYELEYLDFSDKLEPEESFREWTKARAGRVFDLGKGLLDTVLIKLGPQHFAWYLSHHHIVTDGVGIALTLDCLSDLYGQALAGTLPDRIDIPQFADLIDRARTRRPSLRENRADAYWQRKLAVLPGRPAFFGNTPAKVTTRVEHIICRPGFDRSERLRQIARLDGIRGSSLDATLFNIFSALLVTCVHRIGGGSRLLLGAPVHNRRTPVQRKTIGLLLQTLPLEVVVDEDETFVSLLNKIGAEMFGVLRHSPYSDPRIGQSFDMVVNYQTAKVSFQGESVDYEWIYSGHGQKSVLVQIHDYNRSGQFTLSFDLCCQVFTSEKRQQISRFFLCLLDALLDNPYQSIHQPGLLTPEERQHLLVDWNHTEIDYQTDTSLHQLFETQAEKTPLAVAVVFGSVRLTYQQLNNKANQLAHYLKSLDVGAETLVGLFVDRSPEMIVGLLAILKAGGAYVPLSQLFPRQRLQFIIRDASMSLLLTQSHLESLLPDTGINTISLDNWRPDDISVNNPISNIKPTDLAYVIYTSGSTGRPKGVLIEHRQITSYVLGIRQRYQLTRYASYAMLQPLAVDSSQSVIFPPLISGGTLHLISEALVSDAHGLRNYFMRYPVDVLKIAPSHLMALQAAISDPDWFYPRGLLVVGGEVSRRDWAETVAQNVPGRFLNHYGPTETTVGVLTYEVRPNQLTPELKSVPVGQPLPGSTTYILDSRLQPVPVGVAGELYVGGAGVARGYLNLPELSSEKFIPNPFDTSRFSSRLYRTGDSARFHREMDGSLSIEFLGRIDRQVKLRGHRIEVGEIEAALNQQPDVQTSLVALLEDEYGQARLVAYTVPKQPSTKDDELSIKLRSALKALLPDYMIPSAFVLLENLPRTPHGKVDWQALPIRAFAHQSSDQTYIAPRNHIEDQLARIWSSVLNVEPIGIEHNFFELGGHSLLAMQVIAQIQQVFQLDLPFRSFFDHPTIAESGKLLKNLQEVEKPNTDKVRVIPRNKAVETIPLSFSQQRLWLLDRMDAASDYNTSTAVHLDGRLDVIALEASLNELIQRQEILRTTFNVVDGQPVQVIAPHRVIVTPVRDLRNLPDADQDEVCKRLIQEEAGHAFNLTQGPLLRTTLFWLAEESYILLLTMHHIISDGRSKEIFFCELSAFYQAHLAGKAASLPELPVQYADFSLWQRECLNSERLRSLVDYWARQLDQLPPGLAFPLVQPVPTSRTSRGTIQVFSLGKPLADALVSIGKKNRTTLFMTLLTAFKVLLYRYTGQADIVVGTPATNRNVSELEGLIGIFVNTLVLRTNIPAGSDFEYLLAQVREMSLQAFEYQDLPFEKLVEVLQPKREAGRNPLFQVMFALENADAPRLKMTGLSATVEHVHAQTSKFDLSLLFTDTYDDLVGTLEYDTTLFRSSTIARIVDSFQVLLSGIVDNPTMPVSKLPLLTVAERHQTLVEWNQTSNWYPLETTFTRLFDACVEQTPDAVAVKLGNQQLTYSELNARSNQVANYLRQQGVVPDAIVGICVERSPELMVGMLGILKAGGAYLPLNPDIPTGGLATILEDSKTPVLITQSRYLGVLPKLSAEVICLDHCQHRLYRQPCSNPTASHAPGNLAYVIYTSGSTGKPKGVCIEHKSLVNYLHWINQGLFRGKTCHLPVVSKPAFDFSVMHLFAPLVRGDMVWFLPEEQINNPKLLLEAMLHQPDAGLNTIPSLWRLVIEVIERSPEVLPPHRLQGLYLGGEEIGRELLDRTRACLPDLPVWNLYGPTETTGVVTMAPVLPGEPITIGRPIYNAMAYILDEHQQPMPVGLPGELYLGGVGVARGYLNRPDLTAEKFIFNPFGSGRLYRTGDSARWLPDGNIEYLGRLDHQVKFRGLRIEFGEIETAVSRHPAIDTCVVTIREDVPGDKHLVAYMILNQPTEYRVTNSDIRSLITELRQYLKARLPDYMIPAAFVRLDNLPRNANGKIDRKALSSPSSTDLGLTETFIPPEGQVEEKMAAIWRDVLNTETIGRHDNFFELGGHSLLVMQVISRLAGTFGVTLSFVTFFDMPTISGLAKEIDAAHSSSLYRA